jgi:hypothetical protein
MSEEEGEWVLGSYKMAGVGTGVALVCVVGAESTSTRGSCVGGSRRTSPTDGTHGSEMERASERASALTSGA